MTRTRHKHSPPPHDSLLTLRLLLLLTASTLLGLGAAVVTWLSTSGQPWAAAGAGAAAFFAALDRLHRWTGC